MFHEICLNFYKICPNSYKIIIHYASHFRKYYTKSTKIFLGIFFVTSLNKFFIKFQQIINFFKVSGKLTQNFVQYFI